MSTMRLRLYAFIAAYFMRNELSLLEKHNGPPHGRSAVVKGCAPSTYRRSGASLRTSLIPRTVVVSATQKYK